MERSLTIMAFARSRGLLSAIWTLSWTSFRITGCRRRWWYGICVAYGHWSHFNAWKNGFMHWYLSRCARKVWWLVGCVSNDKLWRVCMFLGLIRLFYVTGSARRSWNCDASPVSYPQTSPYVCETKETLLTEECEFVIELFEQCHADHPLTKFMGACNDLKRQLTLCLRAEVQF